MQDCEITIVYKIKPKNSTAARGLTCPQIIWQEWGNIVYMKEAKTVCKLFLLSLLKIRSFASGLLLHKSSNFCSKLGGTDLITKCRNYPGVSNSVVPSIALNHKSYFSTLRTNGSSFWFIGTLDSWLKGERKEGRAKQKSKIAQIIKKVTQQLVWCVMGINSVWIGHTYFHDFGTGGCVQQYIRYIIRVNWGSLLNINLV